MPPDHCGEVIVKRATYKASWNSDICGHETDRFAKSPDQPHLSIVCCGESKLRGDHWSPELFLKRDS